MPAVVDDPASPTIYRVSGQAPFPDPGAPLPDTIVPRRVTLRDRQTVATILPIVSARHQVPDSLIIYLCGQINREIDGGDTYPMMEPFTPAGFAAYWFQNFGAVMLLGDFASADDVPDSHDWARDCLGSFYIKPNYPGRSSHVCNGGLLVTDASRNRGVGRLMGESYIDWAPRLGYTYSVFNLVYETNVASCKIWDALGFKRIGRVKGCGNLKSHPDRLVDGIIYGRDLPPPRVSGHDDDEGGGGDDLLVVSEERFDKIRYYLKYGRYPNGADRAEKSRLRSAATHYKLLEDGDTLMLKDKLVVSDPARQYGIARETHSSHHGGINKTTAIIAEKYHWSRIKETVSDVIRLCKECKELAKAPPGSSSNTSGNGAAPATTPAAAVHTATRATTTSKPITLVAGVKRPRSPSLERSSTGLAAALPRRLSSPPRSAPPEASHHRRLVAEPATTTTSTTHIDTDRVLGLRTHHTNSMLLPGTLSSSSLPPSAVHHPLPHHHHSDGSSPPGPYANPSDITVVRPSQTTLHSGSAAAAAAAAAVGFLNDHAHNSGGGSSANHNSSNNNTADDVYQPIDPQIMNHVDDDGDNDAIHHAFDGYHAHSDFQALLHATEEEEEEDDGGVAERERRAAVDRDLEMLIEHDDDDNDDDDVAGNDNVAAAAALEKTGKKSSSGSGGGGTEIEGGRTGDGGGGGQADADMDDLDDSVLRHARDWT